MIMREMYSEFIEYEDFKEMQEDLAKLAINLILKDDILKVVLCLLRIDTFEWDKDLRTKYSVLKGIQTSDLGIDPYLSMNDAKLFFKEA
jgi:hypothetical protein